MSIKQFFAVFLTICTTLSLPVEGFAQFSTGSDGHDGPLNPTSYLVIDMSDHPDGIYQYSSVNIPADVTVTFIPNARNTPVTWLIQGNCVILGTVQTRGGNGGKAEPGQGGPGGGSGGFGGLSDSTPLPRRGAGPGGGEAASSDQTSGGNGSYATSGSDLGLAYAAPGLVYGNKYLLPLQGGSGGGGAWPDFSGRGYGGGAILIASDRSIRLDGGVYANGGDVGCCPWAGGGSGGGIRLVASQIVGQGSLMARGASGGGDGYVRLDVLDDQFVGYVWGSVSRGFNPILIPPANQNVSLAIQSLGGNVVPGSPSGALSTPDVTIPGQQANPVPIVVRCINIPLNTPITVVAKPVNGPQIVAGGLNDRGTQASSTANVSLNLPRGGGTVYATAVIGLASPQGASISGGKKAASYADTGLTTQGERFAKMEITAALGARQQIAYITDSGKRYFLAPK